MAPRKVPQRCEWCGVVFLPRQSTGKRLQRFCSRGCAGHRTDSSLFVAGHAALNVTHALSGTLQYGAWKAMRARCFNPKNRNFPNYGGRGITICDRWSNYGAFLADVGPRPSPLHTLDRINNDGHYEPGNVRWATTAEQLRNRRVNRLLTFRGETQCLEDWAQHYGLPRDCLVQRLLRGWSLESALLTPRRAVQSSKQVSPVGMARSQPRSRRAFP